MPDRVAWRSRIVDHGELDPRDILPHPSNWRRHPKRQAAALAGALGRVGWVATPTINRTTGRLLDGHLRVEQAIEHGERAIPVSYVELDEHEELLVLASLDPLSAMAHEDDVALQEILGRLREADVDLEALAKEIHPPPKEAKSAERSQFFVLITIESEGDQLALHERLVAEGYRCRLMFA